MLEISIPGFRELKLMHAVFDYNGTLAVEGKLIMGIASQLTLLSSQLNIHIITGDTYGSASNELAGLNCQLTVLPSQQQANAKVEYVRQLDPQITVTIGNGRNDQKMLKKAILGIAVIGMEGASTEALMAADIVVPNIFNAIELLQEPRRLIATLRT